METWKLLAWAAGVFAVFGVVVTVGNVPVSESTVPVVLAVVAIATVLIYAVSKRGYRVGNRLGEHVSEDE